MRVILLLLLFFISFIHSWKLPCKRPEDDDQPIPLGVFVPQAIAENGTLLPGLGPTSYALDLTEATGFDVALGAFAPAIKLALHHIREHSCVLEGYKLQLVYKSTQCTPSLGMKALFDVIASEPRPVAIFGGMCTTVNEPVAMALKFWEIVQLSYAETHPKFSSADSAELFPSFFRIVPAFRNTNEAKMRLISHFGWRRVGTVRQSDEARYALPHEKLTTTLEGVHNVDVIYTGGITHHEIENIGVELDVLKKRDARILIVDVEEDLAAIVACEAFRREMYGKKYVWILPGYHKQRWEQYSGVNCTREELDAVLEGHFAVQFATQRKDQSTKLLSGKSAGHILRDLKSHDGHMSMWATFLYDGLWTLALALGEAYALDGKYNYERILRAVSNLSFEGLTGKVKFENNERLGIVDVLQYKNGSYIEVGFYDGAEGSFELNMDKLLNWTAPLDATIVERKREYIANTLMALFFLLAIIGILMATIFLIINIRYRNHRFIKMSSPNLNNIIIIGSLCTYASIILFGVDTRILAEEHFVKLCYARTWVLCLGFTLTFGSMFSKTWRVHSIFTNIRMDKKAIKDSKLLLMLAVLLALDVIVLSFWAFFSPFRLSITELPRINSVNKVIVPELETCQSDHSVPFQAVLYVIKGILMILGCFLAWETRHVNVPALNDSKYIGMSVYNVVVMSVLGLSIAFILQDRVNEAYALTCLFIIFSTTLTLCLLFVPKVIELVRNPQGVEPKGYRRGGFMKSVVTKQKSTLSPHSLDSEKDLLARAEAENALKHRCLQEKSSQLWDLLEKLRDIGDNSFMQQEWCFGTSGVSGGATMTPDSDPLLGSSEQRSSEAVRNGSRPDRDVSSSRSKDEWPWIDPDQPSTML